LCAGAHSCVFNNTLTSRSPGKAPSFASRSCCFLILFELQDLPLTPHFILRPLYFRPLTGFCEEILLYPCWRFSRRALRSRTIHVFSRIATGSPVLGMIFFCFFLPKFVRRAVEMVFAWLRIWAASSLSRSRSSCGYT